MSAVVADTHTVLWALLTPDKLSPDAKAAMQNALESGDPVYISAISLVEVVYLVEKGRLSQDAYARLSQELSHPDSGLVVVPLDTAVAYLIEKISRDVVRDMPDRIIAATALHLNLPLVTRDLSVRALDIQTIW